LAESVSGGKNPNNQRAPKLNQPHRHLEQATLHE
jgi:hypothetical protein